MRDICLWLIKITDCAFLNYTQGKVPELELLGAPLFRGEALDAALEEQCTIHRRSIRLQKLPSQSTLILTRSSFGFPRIGYLLRCSPVRVTICWERSTSSKEQNWRESLTAP